ncbi:hypothetical protein [Parvularcula marina]|uniref:Ribosomal protein L7/L12 C-terminal domain-containing protein n=1 Tax=Parvularcula marina TaxID=2292771 RepID=A0A371RIB1_9PROT|nr:hypothetical protein [Parvularcula marina]RFB05175.1 hypothetical protein DX908_07850 [Parvularcula marina]
MESGATSLWLLFGVFILGYVMGRFARATDEDRALAQPAQDPGLLVSKLTAEARADIDNLLAEKKVIPAIRRLREDTGAGLRDAKLAVDEIRRSRPEL